MHDVQQRDDRGTCANVRSCSHGGVVVGADELHGAHGILQAIVREAEQKRGDERKQREDREPDQERREIQAPGSAVAIDHARSRRLRCPSRSKRWHLRRIDATATTAAPATQRRVARQLGDRAANLRPCRSANVDERFAAETLDELTSPGERRSMAQVAGCTVTMLPAARPPSPDSPTPISRQQRARNVAGVRPAVSTVMRPPPHAATTSAEKIHARRRR